MANTPNFDLYKPNRADTNVEVDTSLSDNFTKIDTELKTNKDGLAGHISNPNAHTSENVSHADGSVKTTLDNHEERLGGLETDAEGLEVRVNDIETLGLDKLAPNLEGRIQTIESDVEGFLAPATFDAMDQQSYTFDEYRIGYVNTKVDPIAKKTDNVVSILQYESYKVVTAEGYDWKPAFTEAISSMLRGTILLPPNTTFEIYGQIAVRNDIKIIGHPTTVIKCKGNTTFHAFVNFDNVEGGKNINLEGFTIDMNRQNRTNPAEDGSCGIRMFCPDDKRNENINIKNMYVKNSSHAGMYLFNLKNSKVRENLVDDTLRDGIVVWFNSEDVDIIDNYVLRCGDDCIAVNAEADGHTGTIPKRIKIRGGSVSQKVGAVYGNGIRVAGGEGISVHGVNIYDTVGNGIVVERSFSTLTTSKRVSIKGNEIYNCGSSLNNSSGIVVNNNDASTIVEGNIVENHYQHGIYILGEYVSAVNNTVKGGRATGGYGIVLGAIGSQAKNNIVISTPNIGIALEVDETTAIGNTIKDCCVSTPSNPYIRIAANKNLIQLNNNKMRRTVSANGSYGIRVSTGTSDYCQVSNNHAKGFSAGNGVSNGGTGVNNQVVNNIDVA